MKNSSNTFEQERAAFEAWAGVEYRHAKDYTKRDYCMGLAAWTAGRAALQSQYPTLDVDTLAQEIRRVDGKHSLGAGALAEALMPFLQAALQSQDREDVPCRN